MGNNDILEGESRAFQIDEFVICPFCEQKFIGESLASQRRIKLLKDELEYWQGKCLDANMRADRLEDKQGGNSGD